MGLFDQLIHKIDEIAGEGDPDYIPLSEAGSLLAKNTRDLAVTLSGHGGVSNYEFDDSDIDCNDAEYALKAGREAGDLETAGKWFLRAARLGNAEGGALLAAHYLDAGNYTEAYNWAKWSADRGDLTGHGVLGLCILSGRGCSPDRVRGLSLMEQAMEQGDPASTVLLARLYEDDEFGMKDYWKSTLYYEKLFTDAPTREYAEHMRKMYCSGPRELFTDYETEHLASPYSDYYSDGCDAFYKDKDFDKAMKLFLCGFFYESGEDAADCAGKCSYAAMLGNRAFLAFLMGEAYCDDYHGHEDPNPINCYAMALRQGFGDMEKNPEKAFRLFNEALSLQKFPMAMCALADMIFHGEGCVQDKPGAIRLAKEVAAGDQERETAERLLEVFRQEDPGAFSPVVLPATDAPSSASSSSYTASRPSPAETMTPGAGAGKNGSSQMPKSPFLAVCLYGVEHAEDYWSGTVSVNTINRDRTPVAMFNLLLKRPILTAGTYTLKYVFSDNQGNPLSEGTTAIPMGVGSDRLAQAFIVKDDAEGEYHVSFSLTELNMDAVSYTYRIVSDANPVPSAGTAFHPVPSVSAVGSVGGVAMKGTNNGNDFWGGVDVGSSVNEDAFSFAMFQIFTSAPYTGDRVIELRMVIRDCLGSVIRDDCTELEVHAGYDRFAKSLPLVTGDGKRFAKGQYTAEFSIDADPPFRFPFEVS